MTAVDETWLTPADVARRWNFTTREVQRMAARGEIAHLRIGRCIRIAWTTVLAYERAHTRRARSPAPGR